MDQSLHINIKPFTYQCSSKIKPSMLVVEVSLGCMVTVVSKLIVLDQECQIPQLTLKQFRRVTGIAENKQKSIFIQKTMGLNMYMGIIYSLSSHLQINSISYPSATHIIPGTRPEASPAGFPPPNHFLVALKIERWRPLRETIWMFKQIKKY